MKKKIFLALCVAMCAFTGCAQKVAESETVVEGKTDTKADTKDNTENTKEDANKQEQTAQNGDTKENPFSGTYTVPEGWVKSQKYSTQDKWFYVENGHETDNQPDNIAINIGQNRYAKEEHTQFRDAIMKQILPQIKKQKAQLNGEGTYTDKGDVLYIFTITEPDANIVTKQYYIIGDKRYCLIQLTNFSGSEGVTEAATKMAKSFVWDA